MLQELCYEIIEINLKASDRSSSDSCEVGRRIIEMGSYGAKMPYSGNIWALV